MTAIAGEAHAQTFTVECRIPALGVVGYGHRHEPPRGGAGRRRRGATRECAARSGDARDG